jgi:hypothetical protein
MRIRDAGRIRNAIAESTECIRLVQLIDLERSDGLGRRSRLSIHGSTALIAGCQMSQPLHLQLQQIYLFSNEQQPNQIHRQVPYSPGRALQHLPSRLELVDRAS